jgi:regulator of sirC expression with transglutaminase-like and TPR domain
VLHERLVHAFTHAALSPDPELATAALLIARVEYPNVDAAAYLDRLDGLGREAGLRVAAATPGHLMMPPGFDPGHYARVMALNDYLFGELHFVGNDTRYDDPRNSCLNEVLDRRTGIPITLALLYMEVARRAGVHVEGINFPGHFLLRCPASRERGYAQDLIIDAYHGGALLSEGELRRRYQPEDGEETAPWLLAHASKPQILARMLLNLKRIYVKMQSFPQARAVTDLLLAVNPSAIDELRDRGLFAFHLNDFSAALRDLRAYLELSAKTDPDPEEREEHDAIWEQVKAVQRRLAALN